MDVRTAAVRGHVACDSRSAGGVTARRVGADGATATRDGRFGRCRQATGIVLRDRPTGRSGPVAVPAVPRGAMSDRRRSRVVPVLWNAADRGPTPVGRSSTPRPPSDGSPGRRGRPSVARPNGSFGLLVCDQPTIPGPKRPRRSRFTFARKNMWLSDIPSPLRTTGRRRRGGRMGCGNVGANIPPLTDRAFTGASAVPLVFPPGPGTDDGSARRSHRTARSGIPPHVLPHRTGRRFTTLTCDVAYGTESIKSITDRSVHIVTVLSVERADGERGRPSQPAGRSLAGGGRERIAASNGG
jgi:hypothetical protein